MRLYFLWKISAKIIANIHPFDIKDLQKGR